MNWIYNGEEITEKNIPKEFKKHQGFIYCITVYDKGKELFYIGQKTFRLKDNRKIGKKELETYPDKRKLRRRKVKKGKQKGEWIYYEERYKENWLEYTSSSDIVNNLISKGKPYKKEIIQLVKTKGLLNYAEMKQIVCNECMEIENCLNDHVGNYYKRNIINKI